MEFSNKKVNTVESNYVPRFINDLVNSLYTDEINKIIESDNVQVDKKMFLMFIVTFFITRLFCEKDSKSLNADEIKIFMTELLLTNKTKRKQCMELFLQLNNVIGSAGIETAGIETAGIETAGIETAGIEHL